MAQPKLKWVKIGENLKVAKWNSENDIRTFNLRGYHVYADFIDVDPRTNKQLEQSEWFIYAYKNQL